MDKLQKLLENRAKDIDYEEPEASNQYNPVDFLHAAEMLAAIDPIIRDGQVKLHRWQLEDLVFLSSKQFTKSNQLEYGIQAANGCGKDAYEIAPLSIFKSICRVRSRTIITSSSYAQLNLQTESYIRTLAHKANDFLIQNGIWQKEIKINKQHIVVPETGSEIILFTTDEGGRAEGYHPFPDYPDGEVTIILNEAKSIPDLIFEHLSRCTYSVWLEVSSPGRTSGKFYQHCTKGIYHPEKYQQGRRYIRKVKSSDCPHISKNKIDKDRIEMGEASPLFKSMHEAEFSSVDESVVITQEVLHKCLDKKISEIKIGLGKHAGLDLAKGGDENTLYVFQENKFYGADKFRMGDTTETVEILISLFGKYGLEGKEICADDGHVGGAIIDSLHKRGYQIRRVCNSSRPVNPRLYSNRGAELWFNFARLVQECIVELPIDDVRLHSQLVNRYYDQSDQGKFKLESKDEARQTGHGSPDRADAVVLAWTGITIMDYVDKKPEIFSQASILTQKTITSLMDNRTSGLPSFMRRQLKEITNNKNIGNILRNIYKSR